MFHIIPDQKIKSGRGRFRPSIEVKKKKVVSKQAVSNDFNVLNHKQCPQKGHRRPAEGIAVVVHHVAHFHILRLILAQTCMKESELLRSITRNVENTAVMTC